MFTGLFIRLLIGGVLWIQVKFQKTIAFPSAQVVALAQICPPFQMFFQIMMF